MASHDIEMFICTIAPRQYQVQFLQKMGGPLCGPHYTSLSLLRVRWLLGYTFLWLFRSEANSCFFAPVPFSIIAVFWASSSHFVNLNFCASSSTLGIRCSILRDERARHYSHLPSYLAPFHEVNQDTMRSLCAICHSMPPSRMPSFHFPSKNTPFPYFIPVNDICSLDDHAYTVYPG